MAALMWPFWYRRGDYHEARAWLERAAETVLREPVAAVVMAAVLTGAGVLAFLQCDYAVAAERLTKARAVYAEEGDQVGLATTLQRLGSIAREEGRYADARTLHEESLAIWEDLADPAGVAASQDYLAFTAWLAGEGILHGAGGPKRRVNELLKRHRVPTVPRALEPAAELLP